MGKITFVLGGARSGKSSQALKLAKAFGGRVAFVATCQGLDSEMKKRIALHKQSRPKQWKTFEEGYEVDKLLNAIGGKFDVIIIDCLTLLVSNLMLEEFRDNAVEIRIKKVVAALKKIKADSVMVSNEVGLGIVPENKLARRFRDVAGRANQIIAGSSEEVYFMVSGIAWRIK